ncbi:MAG: glycosyltransferase family 39 protein, partial [Candidatus Moraniibacteriota bacterium]
MVFPKFQWSPRITLVFLLGVIVIINLSFGLPRIARFSAVDEHLWTYDRVPRFWRAVEKGDWRKTDINDKPGITIALVSGVGLLFSDPVSHESARTAEKDAVALDQVYRIDASFRFPVYIFSLCMIPVFFFLIWRLFEDRWIAFFATAFTFLSPILLGISLIVNPDSFLWLFLPCSLISFLVFLKREVYGYALLSGFFLGLALLTKYVATILFPFFLLSIFLARIFPIQKQSTASAKFTDRSSHKEVLRTGLFGFFTMILSSFATITIFYPAVWVSFNTLLQTTFLSRPMASVWPFLLAGILSVSVEVFPLKAFISRRVVHALSRYRNLCGAMVASLFLVAVLFVFANVYMGMQWIDFPSLLAVPKASGVWSVSDLFAGALTGLYGLVFGITPVVLAFFILAVASLIFIKKSASYRNEKHQSIMLILLIFISIYYLASAVNFVDATVRYQISLYPLASIIAAIGVSQCYKWTR